MMFLSGSAGALVAIALGVLICFFGYRLLRVTLGVFGFAVGAALGGLIVSSIAGVAQVFVLIVALAAGILGAVLAAVVYKVGVFLLGAGAAALVASFFAAGAGGASGTLVVIVAAILGGLLTLFLQKPAVSVLTAFGGAWGVVAGVFHLVGWYDLQQGFQSFQGLRGTPGHFLVVIACWLVLGMFGTIAQLAAGRKRR